MANDNHDISRPDVFFSLVFFFYLRGCLAAWALIQEEGAWKINSSAKCVTIKSRHKNEPTDKSTRPT